MRTADDWPPGKIALRDKALALFAERGPGVVTIRDVAAAAGVSPGLVVHHFGTKDALREAVDEYVAETLEQIVATVDADLLGAEPPAAAAGIAALMLDHLPVDSPVPAYLRSLLLLADGTGRRLFRRWHAGTVAMIEQMVAAGVIRPSGDADLLAAVMLSNDLAMLLLRPQLTDATGVDPFTPEGMHRWARVVMDIYANGVIVPGGPGEREERK